MDIAVKMAKMSSEGRERRRWRRRRHGGLPHRRHHGERHPLAPFLHGFMGALPIGDGIHGRGENMALGAANTWEEVSPMS
jgi:hypothetical protein